MNNIQTASIFRDFVARIPNGARVSILGHSDTDGLAAAAILTRALNACGFEAKADVTRKGENAWSGTTLYRLAANRPAALVVADLGSRTAALLPDIPTLIVDHHRPTGVPPGATLITAYGDEAPATSGLLAYWCAAAIEQQQGLDWIAAVSILADMGDQSALEEWAAARKRYSFTSLRETATLLNAPRRTAAGDATLALDMLLRAPDPKAFLADPGTEALRAAKAEYNAALEVGRRVAPQFSGTVALIPVNGPCQIHPAVAQTWSGRLKNNIVLCANRGYLPSRVNFAMRTKLDVNLIEFLAQHRPSDAGEEFGRGHDRATGGSLLLPQWNDFIQKIGFPASTTA